MTDSDERLLRAHVTTLWETSDDVSEAVELIVRFVKCMQNEQAKLWKGRCDAWRDRCEAEQQAHEATIKHMESEGRR